MDTSKENNDDKVTRRDTNRHNSTIIYAETYCMSLKSIIPRKVTLTILLITTGGEKSETAESEYL